MSAERSINVYERDDPELTAIAVCMTALRDLDANAAARVARYLVERHPPGAPPLEWEKAKIVGPRP